MGVNTSANERDMYAARDLVARPKFKLGNDGFQAAFSGSPNRMANNMTP